MNPNTPPPDALFTKVGLKPRSLTRNAKEPSVLLTKNDLFIDPRILEVLGWKEYDRLDLLQSGDIFALTKDPVGVLNLTKRSKGSASLRICSKPLVTHLNRVTPLGLLGYSIDKTNGRLILMRKV